MNNESKQLWNARFLVLLSEIDSSITGYDIIYSEPRNHYLEFSVMCENECKTWKLRIDIRGDSFYVRNKLPEHGEIFYGKIFASKDAIVDMLEEL